MGIFAFTSFVFWVSSFLKKAIPPKEAVNRIPPQRKQNRLNLFKG